ARLLLTGDTARVTYPADDARFVHVGSSYRVEAFGRPPSRLSSTVRAGDCQGEEPLTRHADGTAINTSVFTRDGIAPYVMPLAIGSAVALALVLLLAAHHRRRHPRLTIDGRPR